MVTFQVDTDVEVEAMQLAVMAVSPSAMRDKM
jgi:hypothetical protein